MLVIRRFEVLTKLVGGEEKLRLKTEVSAVAASRFGLRYFCRFGVGSFILRPSPRHIVPLSSRPFASLCWAAGPLPQTNAVLKSPAIRMPPPAQRVALDLLAISQGGATPSEAVPWL